MTVTLCVTAFAAGSDTVALRVSALKKDGSTVFINEYSDLAEGWNQAIALANDGNEMKKNEYDRIVIDIYADWVAVDGGFSDSGVGFNSEAIQFPDDVRVTMNLNGHTIDRGIRDGYRYNGEVIRIGENADVIINGGTITGGWSCNVAGGIRIGDGANVTLNNVNVVGNIAEDSDGAAIAVYEGATLTMKGGSLADNAVLSTTEETASFSTGVLYVEDAEAHINGVTIQNNVAKNHGTQGIAVTAVKEAYVKLDDCKLLNNGGSDASLNCVAALSIIYAKDNSTIDITGCEISSNGSADACDHDTAIIYIREGSMEMIQTNLTGNRSRYLLKISDSANAKYSHIFIKGGSMKDNLVYGVFTGCCKDNAGSRIESVTFNNNKTAGADGKHTFCFDKATDLTFWRCELGDSTFNDRNLVKFTGLSMVQGNGLRLASVFGEGSVSDLISLLALAVSVASVVVIVVSNNKQDASEKKTANPDE